MFIANQQNSKISVPKYLAIDMPVGAASIDMEEFLVYLVMRNWSKPCGEVDDVRLFLPDADETDWVYELDGYYRGPKQIMSYLYDVSYNSRSDFTKRIKLHIGSLICSGLVVLRNKITGHLYDSNEYMAMTKEEWGSGEDFVFYFPVPVNFYAVSNSGLEAIVRLCKQNKDREVAYFVTLFAILEYYFSISTDPSSCWMISPVSTFFTSRTSLWRRINPVLETVGISHTFKQYMDENGELKTKQIFERRELDDELPFDIKEPEQLEPEWTPYEIKPMVFSGEEEIFEEVIELEGGGTMTIPISKADKFKLSDEEKEATGVGVGEKLENQPVVGKYTGKVFEPEPYALRDFAAEQGYYETYEKALKENPDAQLLTPEELNDMLNATEEKKWLEEQKKEFFKADERTNTDRLKANANSLIGF